MKKIISMAALLLAIAFLLCACGSTEPNALVPSEVPDESSAPAEQTNVPDVTEGPVITEAPAATDIPELVEGEKIGREAFLSGYRPGVIMMSSGIRGISRSDNFYEYRFDALPDYSDEAQTFSGRSYFFYLENADLFETFRSRAVTSSSDAAYLEVNLVGIEYRAVTEQDNAPFPANCHVCVIIKNEDGSAELYGIGQDEYAFKAVCGTEAELGSAVFTEISTEPLQELVSLHIGAAAFHYMYETELPTQFASYSDAGFGAIIKDGAAVKLGGSSLAEAISLLEGKTYIGDGDPSSARDIHTFGDPNAFPEGSLKLVFDSVDSGRDPTEYTKYTVVTPDGKCIFVQEGPVAFTVGSEYQYVVGAAHIIEFPYSIDYNALLSLTGGN